MSKVDITQESFVAGEFAPVIFGRADIAQYENACASLENMIIRPSGAVKSTPGSEFINDAKYDTTFNPDDSILPDVYLDLYFEGADGSQTFIDSSSYANPVSLDTGGDTRSTISIDYSKFGNSSFKMVYANKPWLVVSSSTLFDINTSSSNLTIESFFLINRNTGSETTNTWFSRGSNWASPGTTGYGFGLTYTAGNYYLYFYINRDLVYGAPQQFGFQSDIISISFGEWYHVAATYNALTKTIKLYFNKEYVGGGVHSSSYSQMPAFGTINCLIGRDHFWCGDGPSDNAPVYFDNLRVTGRVLTPEQFIGTTRIYNKSRLIPFVFSKDDSYIIETGPSYFRFYTDGAVVTA